MFASPPGRIASARSDSGAEASASHVGQRRRISSNARSLLRSDVFCESTVRISSSRGSHRRGGSSGPNRRRRRATISPARTGPGGAGPPMPDGGSGAVVGTGARGGTRDERRERREDEAAMVVDQRIGAARSADGRRREPRRPTPVRTPSRCSRTA